MASEPARARLLWAILCVVLPVTLGHTAACRCPALPFFAAINLAMKRSAPCSAVWRYPPSSWAAVVHWSALIPEALRSSRRHTPIHSFSCPPRGPRPPPVLRTSRTSAVSCPICAPQILQTTSASCTLSPRCSHLPSSSGKQIGNRVVGGIVLSPTDAASREAVVCSAQRVVMARAWAPHDVAVQLCVEYLGSSHPDMELKGSARSVLQYEGVLPEAAPCVVYANSFVWLYTWPVASALNIAVASGIPFARKHMISILVSGTVRPNAAHTTMIMPMPYPTGIKQKVASRGNAVQCIIASLPHTSLDAIRRFGVFEKAETVALQFPEGLLMYACVVSDILEQFANCQCVILGDVTYGACCIDDLTAEALGCSLLIHYGHSCLVPIAVTAVKVLYVFVEISIDTAHLAACIRETFPPTTKLVVMGTIQFAGAVHEASRQVVDHFDEVTVPQAKPLSPGEVLGCTSPVMGGKDALVFVADGRFHLESAMIHNPNMQHFRYNPYTKALTREGYDTKKMHAIRRRAIEVAQGAKSFGVILGTLGRQGNPHILEHLTRTLRQKGKQYFVLLLSEIFPAKLAAFDNIEAWIQVACPRLSIDWGHFFSKPLLSPYEADVALGETAWRDVYPMDFYANGSGAWTNQHEKRVS